MFVVAWSACNFINNWLMVLNYSFALNSSRMGGEWTSFAIVIVFFMRMNNEIRTSSFPMLVLYQKLQNCLVHHLHRASHRQISSPTHSMGCYGLFRYLCYVRAELKRISVLVKVIWWKVDVTATTAFTFAPYSSNNTSGSRCHLAIASTDTIWISRYN